MNRPRKCLVVYHFFAHYREHIMRVLMQDPDWEFEMISDSDLCYQSNRQLRKNPPQADVYICGSDQIWNASEQFGIDPSYFLDFAPEGIQRIAYAASFGRPKVHPRFKSSTADLIRSMDAISVREQSGVGIIKDLSNRDSEWVPDPTLLVNDG
jgi:hypothetical protein